MLLISQLTRSLFSPPKNLLTGKNGRKEKGKTALEEGLGGKKRTDVSSSFIFYFIPFPFRRNGRHGRSRSLALEEHEREREREGKRGEKGGRGWWAKKGGRRGRAGGFGRESWPCAASTWPRHTLLPSPIPSLRRDGLSREPPSRSRPLSPRASRALSLQSLLSPSELDSESFLGIGARKKLLDIVFAASKEKNQKDPPPEFTLRECPPVPVTWSSSTWAGPTSRRPSRR